MKLVAFTCPACGAQLNVDIEKGQASCQFCGTTFPIDDEAQHIRYDNAEQAGYEFEKGRQRAQAEFAQSSTQQPYQIPSQPMQIPEQQGRPKKKRKTWLWVLGWIFIFPIPLTILMMRNKKLDEKVRIGIIVIAWIIYIGMGASSGKDKSDASAEGAGSEIEVSQTIAEDDKSDSAETSDDNKSDASDSEDAGSQAAEFVIGRLTGVEHIQEPTAATKDHDPNKGLSKDDSYIAAVFFSSDLVEEKVKGDDVIDRGTDGGGCVEVFRNEKDAQARDEYLGSVGSFLSLAGSHTTNGEYVIRTSRYLSDSQQQKLEASIIKALTADEAEVAKKAEAEKGVEADKEAETTKKDAATQKKTSKQAETSTKTNTNAGSKPKATSKYEYAYIRSMSDYDLYYLIDLDDKTVTYFGTNDSGSMVLPCSGDLDNGLTVDYVDDGFQEHLKFKRSGDDSILILTDSSGFDWEYTKTDISEAEAVLKSVS